DPDGSERVVREPQVQVWIRGIGLHEIIAKATGQIMSRIATPVVVDQDGVQERVIARGRVDRTRLVERKPPGHVLPRAIERAARDAAVVAHDPAVLALEEALDESLDPGDAWNGIDPEPVDAAKLPAGERAELGRRAVEEGAHQAMPRHA